MGYEHQNDKNPKPDDSAKDLGRLATVDDLLTDINSHGSDVKHLKPNTGTAQNSLVSPPVTMTPDEHRAAQDVQARLSGEADLHFD